MIDMTNFVASKSDQLTADDLIERPRTILITRVTASPDATEQPVNIWFDGDDGRPFRPCKTVRRLMIAIWGKYANKYVGRSMTLYRDPTVMFGGMEVGGIRVSHMSDISEKKTVALQVTRGRKAQFTVLPLTDEPPKESAADKWAGAFIAKLSELGSDEEVDALEKKHSAKLAELLKAMPHRHAEVTAAIVARKSAVSADPLEAAF